MAGYLSSHMPLISKNPPFHVLKEHGFSVLTGGSWLPEPSNLRSNHRHGLKPRWNPIPITLRAVSKTGEDLPSVMADLEIEESVRSEGKGGDSSNQKLIADRWREIMGENDWAGLLDPMDPLLRSELIRYGEKAQSCYDAFESDPSSMHYGSSRFSQKGFYKSLGMAESGYDIARFLYVTFNFKLPNFFYTARHPHVWRKNSNWIGFIAVSNDEMSKKLGRRDVCIVWRGTITKLEWIADMITFLRPVSSDKLSCPDPSVRVESGFLDLYTDKEEDSRHCNMSVREQILAEVNKLVNTTYANEEVSITVTGHSLGGALALLSAYDIAETGVLRRKNGETVPICAFTFAGPRVGNARFKERVDLLGVKVLRVVNVHDVVPKGPGFLVNEDVHPFIRKIAANFPWNYSHVGVELALDHLHSPYLRPNGDLADAHNLEAQLHLLDGYHGTGRSFEPNGRDYALVNKSSDFLKDELGIITSWWQHHNKGMIIRDGRWIQDDRLDLDDD